MYTLPKCQECSGGSRFRYSFISKSVVNIYVPYSLHKPDFGNSDSWFQAYLVTEVETKKQQLVFYPTFLPSLFSSCVLSLTYVYMCQKMWNTWIIDLKEPSGKIGPKPKYRQTWCLKNKVWEMSLYFGVKEAILVIRNKLP